MDPVDIDAALATFTETWSPRLLASINDYDVKLVKVEGDFTWHSHEDTDELFLVLDGELTIALDGPEASDEVVLGPRQLYVIPRGVQHLPRARPGTSVLLLEPRGVVNTGDTGGPLTAETQPL
jgi:mannose-6-phosphate isomerase-like protein (cupin superfamily)